MREEKEPKVLRVPSPGDGRYWEQIEVDGENKYVFYSPADNLIKNERWVTDAFHHRVDEEGRQIRYNTVKYPLWEMAGAPLEPGLDLWDSVRGYFFDHVEFTDDRLYDVATAFTFLSWIREGFDVVPYLRFLGSKNTGKTRAMRVLLYLCYRAVLSPSVTEAVLYRLCQDYNVTYLLDETEHYSNEAKASIQNVLNAGYKRDSQVLRCATAEDGSIIITGFRVFGPKAIAGTRILRDTLESRCIPFIMARNNRNIRYEIDKRNAKELRSKLLLWRFRRLHDLAVLSEGSEGSGAGEGYLGPTPPLQSITNSRIVELFAPLLKIADNEKARKNIVSYALSVWEERNEEDATGVEAEILSAIKLTHSDLESGKFSTRLVTTYFNTNKPDKEHWRASSVGRVVKRLGFKPKRMSGGRAGWIYDAKLVDKLLEQCAVVDSEGRSSPPLLEPSPHSLPSYLSPDGESS